jgi:hypothetical protein
MPVIGGVGVAGILGIPFDWFIGIVVAAAIIVAIWAWWKLS